MRLSMNILADWLKKYKPRAGIIDGGRVIRNVRPFSDGHDCTPNNVYVSRDAEGVICINRNDVLYLHIGDAEQVINDVMDAFDFYNTWSDELRAALPELTLEELLRRSRAALPYFLMVADPSYYTLACENVPADIRGDEFGRSYMETKMIDLTYILSLEQNPIIRRPSRRAYLLSAPAFAADPSVRNLFLGGQHFGWLILVEKEITPGMMDIQDELGDLIESWIAVHTPMQDRLNRNGVFFELLSGSAADENRIRTGLILLGVRAEDEKMLYRIELPGSLTGYAILQRLDGLSPHGHNLIFEKGLVSVFSGTQAERSHFEAGLAGLLSETDGVCGASPAFSDVFTLPGMHELAAAALRFGREKGGVTHFDEAALPYALYRLKRETGPWLTHPALGILGAYDRENGMELKKTLRVYLECERNYADTARALNIHRNTLLYRISRIGDLTGLDLESPETRLHLLLSFAVAGK